MSDSNEGGWRIFVGDTLIGTAYYHHIDQPWYICTFEPTVSFDTYRPIFDEYASLVNSPSPDMAHIDIGEYYESKIGSLNLRLEPFGNVWQGDVYIAQIYDASECWIRPL